MDFTGMSDRQLAEFFKKPPSSVCGRVYNDQLNRDIVIPKKRIPWFKYFFQFTWPALVFLLKSCGMKESSKGKIKIERISSGHEYPMTSLGFIMPGQELNISEITPVDTTVDLKKDEIKVNDEIMGDVALITKTDSIAMPNDTLGETVAEYKPLDTVTVIGYSYTTGKMLVGAISVCKVESAEVKEDSVKREEVFTNEMNFKVYPNPVQAGSLLNISFKSSDDFPQRIQILSSSGQLVSQVKQNGKEYAAVTNIQIPSNLTAGAYFLQAITKSKKVKTAKFIVTR